MPLDFYIAVCAILWERYGCISLDSDMQVCATEYANGNTTPADVAEVIARCNHGQ